MLSKPWCVVGYKDCQDTFRPFGAVTCPAFHSWGGKSFQNDNSPAPGDFPEIGRNVSCTNRFPKDFRTLEIGHCTSCFLRYLGATHLLDRSRAPSDILSLLQEITEGMPIEYVYDAVSFRRGCAGDSHS